MTSKIKTVTLGCKVNQYETQLVREGLLSVGFVDAAPDEPADLCVVNTCTVTHEGDAKGRQLIRRLHRENPQARIVVMGCYATRAPEEVARLPGVSEVITDKREIPDLLGRFGVIDLPTGIRGLHGRQRAYVKVQDGCLLRCTYCIIPMVRPTMYSRPAADIVNEVRGLIETGHREIVLTGIHLGHYGVDFNRQRPRSEWTRLATLVRQLCEIPEDFRVRLSSIEATEVTKDLIEVLRDYPEKVAPHLHVCLQSGSDRILQRMDRRWNAKRIVDRCQAVAEVLDDPAMTTDVIVGFPGESEDDFAETLDVCRQIGFSKIHSFPFSARKGTPAAEFPDQIDAEVKAERMRRLAELEVALRDEYFGKLMGKPLRVLVEKIDKGVGLGTSCRYATCAVPAGRDVAIGSFVQFIPSGVDRESGCLV